MCVCYCNLDDGCTSSPLGTRCRGKRDGRSRMPHFQHAGYQHSRQFSRTVVIAPTEATQRVSLTREGVDDVLGRHVSTVPVCSFQRVTTNTELNQQARRRDLIKVSEIGGETRRSRSPLSLLCMHRSAAGDDSRGRRYLDHSVFLCVDGTTGAMRWCLRVLYCGAPAAAAHIVSRVGWSHGGIAAFQSVPGRGTPVRTAMFGRVAFAAQAEALSITLARGLPSGYVFLVCACGGLLVDILVDILVEKFAAPSPLMEAREERGEQAVAHERRRGEVVVLANYMVEPGCSFFIFSPYTRPALYGPPRGRRWSKYGAQTTFDHHSATTELLGAVSHRPSGAGLSGTRKFACTVTYHIFISSVRPAPDKGLVHGGDCTVGICLGWLHFRRPFRRCFSRWWSSSTASCYRITSELKRSNQLRQ